MKQNSSLLGEKSKENQSNISDIQEKILQILLKKPCHQNELQKLLATELNRTMSAQNLAYHLTGLIEQHLIEKRTVAQIGNARINEIAIHPGQLQQIRNLLQISIEKLTLITGFGALAEGYRLPDLVMEQLTRYHIQISKIICFTSKDAFEIRNKMSSTSTTPLITIDRCYPDYSYETDYCNVDSDVFERIDQIIQSELQSANVIIDLTPLSKLYSFRLLKLANRYHLPCFFLGRDHAGGFQLIWMSEVNLEGKMIPM